MFIKMHNLFINSDNIAAVQVLRSDTVELTMRDGTTVQKHIGDFIDSATDKVCDALYDAFDDIDTIADYLDDDYDEYN